MCQVFLSQDGVDIGRKRAQNPYTHTRTHTHTDECIQDISLIFKTGFMGYRTCKIPSSLVLCRAYRGPSTPTLSFSGSVERTR